MAQELTNFARFYALFNKLPFNGDREEFKKSIVLQYTWNRTDSLREMTRLEYKTCCEGLEKLAGVDERRQKMQEELKYWRSVCLRLMQKMGIDTSTPSGKLLIPIFSMLAEIDQVLRTERTVAGWEVAKREGRTGGRKPGLNDLAKKKAEQAKKMYLSKDPFYSAKEIASILNISTRTLYKYLRSVGVEPKQNQ